MKELSRQLGEMEFDGLITDLVPPIQVRGGILAAVNASATYKRGSVLAKSTANGKLYLLGSTAASGDTLIPDCILCDDTALGTSDVDTVVYTAGCFDPHKLHMAQGYRMSEADRDKLRERGIVFKTAFAN